MFKWIGLSVCLAVFGCGDNDDDDNGGAGGAGAAMGEGGAGEGGGAGAACGMLGADPTVTFTSITKNDGSDANCPDLTVDVLNSNDGEGGEGGEGDDCEPTINAEACELVFDCPADGLTGTVGITNDGFSGTITVVVGEVSCAYTLGGTIE